MWTTNPHGVNFEFLKHHSEHGRTLSVAEMEKFAEFMQAPDIELIDPISGKTIDFIVDK